MEYSQKKFGERLRQYREAKGFTRKQLSNISGVNDGYINNLENGQGQSLSYEKLALLASALNISMDSLLVDSLVKYQKSKSEDKEISKIIQEMEASNLEDLQEFQQAVNEFLKYKENK